MPYHIKPDGGQFLVVDDSDKIVGTHPTRQQAIDNLKALYANVSDATKEVSPVQTGAMLHGPGSLMGVQGMSDETEVKATADINDLPDSAFLHVESGGTKDDAGKTVPRSLRHLPYKTSSGTIDLPKLRNALSRLGQTDTGVTGGDKWLTAALRDSLRAKAEKILTDENDKTNKEVKPSLLDRVFNVLTGKEGRRNSTNDAANLQQIHDLSVANGATCPMVFKQANGSSRWILLSTNSYQDRDGEIVTQDAQERDIARMKETGVYGPLRLWHIGDPDPIARTPGIGADIGDCDYAEMFGRIRVESGTFRDERVAAAIKERADQWAGSVGFFHPLSQPDRDGAFDDIYTFERSLLPTGRASNYLTPLAAIIKEHETMTNKEKADKLAEMLGDPALADTVLKQVEATEKAAEERGLKFKQVKDDRPAEAVADKAAKVKADEGSPEEESTESAAEAAGEPDWEAMAKGLAPHFEKMMKSYMEAGKKETAEKEAGLTAQITTLEATVKEQAAQLAGLIDNAPRAIAGRRGFNPAEASGNIVRDAKIAGKEINDGKANQGGLAGIADWILNITPPVKPE